MLAQEASEGLQDSIEHIDRSSRRLLDTINSVLDLSKLETGVVEPAPEPIDVAGEVLGTAEIFQPQADEQDVTLRTEAPETPMPAELDPTMLHRITDNLAGNALTFTDAGGTVTLRTCGPDEAITVEVEDAGISSEDDFSPTCSSRPLGATRPQGERAADWRSPSRNGRRSLWTGPLRWTARRASALRSRSASHGERSARGRVGERVRGNMEAREQRRASAGSVPTGLSRLIL